MSKDSWNDFIHALKKDNQLRSRYTNTVKQAQLDAAANFAQEHGYNVDIELIINDDAKRAKKRSYFIIGFLGIISITALVQTFISPAISVETARRLLNEQRLDEAIKMTDKILKERQDSEAYFLRGRAYQDKRQPQKAIDEFTKAIAINNAVDYYFYSRGNAYRSIGMEPTATIDFKKAIDINPSNVNAYGNLGLSLYKQNKLDDAITYLDEAIRIEPNHANNLRMRGDIKYAVGDTWGSISDFNSCIEIDARKAETQSYRSDVVAQCYEAKGWSYLKLDNARDACINWKRAISLGRAKLSAAIDQYCKR